MVSNRKIILSFVVKKAESDLVSLAKQIAAQAHAGQKRLFSNADYIIHPTRISARLRAAGASEVAQAAALLHDVLEDTELTEGDLLKVFPPQVVVFVKQLSKWWPDSADKELIKTQNPLYLENIKKSQETVIIKLHDISDNLDETRKELIKLLRTHRHTGSFSGKPREALLKLRRFLFRFATKQKPLAEDLMAALGEDLNKAALDAIRHYQTSTRQVTLALEMVESELALSGIKLPPLEKP